MTPPVTGLSLPAPVILASASPRRRELLARIVPSFEVRPSDIDEIRQPGESPGDFAVRAALDKAVHVSSGVARGLVIAMDTVVVLGEDVLGKPASPEDAIRMLRRLSGNEHRVITGLAIVEKPSERTVTLSSTTFVRFKELTGSEMASYVDSGEPLDKAGAYGIQGTGGLFVREIRGCYYNVVGLPLNLLYETLSGFAPDPKA